MSVRIENYREKFDVSTFTLHAPNIAYPNAIRRTCLADIPITVFKTTPNPENLCEIKINSTRTNNEIIKQRLNCIPIHQPDVPVEWDDMILELDVQNNTDNILVVTTKHFKVKNMRTNEYVNEEIARQIFPPFSPGNGNNYYIEFVHLFPKITDSIEGEHIQLTCRFSVGTARDDGAFNVMSTIGVGFTPDRVKMEEELEKRKQTWKNEGKNDSQIIFEAENWKLLEGLRYVIKNSFDFTVETVGTYTNDNVIVTACDILLEMLVKLYRSLGDPSDEPINISTAETTLENCFDVTLPNEDYTISNILNANIINMFYQNPDVSLNTVSYIGVKKMHPHTPETLLRIAFFDTGATSETVRQTLIAAIEEGVKIIKEIKALFNKRK